MTNYLISELEPIKVTRVRAVDGVEGASSAMDKLESRMDSLRGRKMYGVYYPSSDEYYACLKLDNEHSDNLGFETATIPGGKYVRVKVKN